MHSSHFRLLSMSMLLTVVALMGCKKVRLPGTGGDPANKFDASKVELGVNVHTPGYDNYAERLVPMKNMGAKWVRVDAPWCSIEQEQDRFEWIYVDRMVDRARSLGMSVLMNLSCTPDWAAARGEEGSGVPNKADWENFVDAVARHYAGRVQAYNIWNEPNSAGFWTGSASEYVQILLKPAAGIIRAQGAGAIVTGPELAHLYTSTIPMVSFFQAVVDGGGLDYLDVLSHHSYGDPDFRNNIEGYYAGHTLVKEGLKQMLQRTGIYGKKPVWITEYGSDSRTQGLEGQASRVKDSTRFMGGIGWIAKMFVFEMDDVDPRAPYNYGILNQDGTTKPLYDALKSLFNP